MISYHISLTLIDTDSFKEIKREGITGFSLEEIMQKIVTMLLKELSERNKKELEEVRGLNDDIPF